MIVWKIRSCRLPAWRFAIFFAKPSTRYFLAMPTTLPFVFIADASLLSFWSSSFAHAYPLISAKFVTIRSSTTNKLEFQKIHRRCNPPSSIFPLDVSVFCHCWSTCRYASNLIYFLLHYSIDDTMQSKQLEKYNCHASPKNQFLQFCHHRQQPWNNFIPRVTAFAAAAAALDQICYFIWPSSLMVLLYH